MVNLSKFRVVSDDAQKIFATYSNYLLHVAMCLEAQYGRADDGLHSAVAQCARSHTPVTKIQRRQLESSDEVQLMRALRLSWATEAQLRLRGRNDVELLPDLLHGAASEAYYAVYHAARAFFIASGASPPANHTAALNQLSTVVAQRNLLLPPWCVRVTGGPNRDQFSVSGIPTNATISDSFSNLTTPASTTVWESITKALCTTRERQLREKRDDWCSKQSTQRLPPSQALAFANSTQPTTLFNFLWRLRKRSDYRDADVFLDGVWSPEEAMQYHTALANLVASTITLLDTLTVVYCGPDPYRNVAEPFTRPARAEVYAIARQRFNAVVS